LQLVHQFSFVVHSIRWIQWCPIYTAKTWLQVSSSCKTEAWNGWTLDATNGHSCWRRNNAKGELYSAYFRVM